MAADDPATFADFVKEAKQRFLELGQKVQYRHFLLAVKDRLGRDIVISRLSAHPDLVPHYSRLCGEEAAAAADKSLPTAGKVLDVEEVVLAPLRARCSEVATQLASLVLGGHVGARASTRLAAVRYIRQMAGATGERNMVLLRGPPGIGKSSYAEGQVRLQLMPAVGEEAVARALHVCSEDDFMAKYQFETNQEKFCYDSKRVDLARAQNLGRVQLCMDIGIHPLYIDNCHPHSWQMEPYKKLAQDAGYTIVIVEPEEIFPEWRSVAAILKRERSRSALLTEAQLEEHLIAWGAAPRRRAAAKATEAPAETTDEVMEDVSVTTEPVAKAPAAKAPVAKAPVAKAPVAKAPVAKAPVAKAPIAKAPIAKAPIAKAPLPKATAHSLLPSTLSDEEEVSEEEDEESKVAAALLANMTKKARLVK